MTEHAEALATPEPTPASAGRHHWLRTTAMAGAAVLAVSLGAGTAAVVASSGDEPAPPPPAATSAVVGAWTSCVDDADHSTRAEGRPRLAEDFVPVAVVTCARESKRRADGGTDLVEVERHGEEVAALEAALRLPDLTTTDVACRASLVSVPWFALLDTGGRWVRPGPPMGTCGGPRKEVLDAVADLRLRHVATTPIGVIESAAAVAAGCAQGWKNEIAIHLPPRGSAASGPGVDVGGEAVRLCVYRVRADLPDNGEFVRGGLLPPDRRAAIGRALRAAGPAAACAEVASRFAVLRASQSHPVSVELDGCQRILVHPATGARRNVLAQGDSPLIRLIEES